MFRCLGLRREYTPAEFIALLSPYPLDFAPGTRWAYTNSAYRLLGRASGIPYDEFVAARIFRPLAMEATRFSRPQDIVPRRAGGYVEESGRMRKGELLRPRLVEPNGGILSTVLDLAKWETVLHSERLLKQASLAETQTTVKLADGRATPSGLGIFVADVNGHRMLVHNGSTPGGFSSVLYHYPDDKLTLIVLCNIDRDDAVNVIATHVAGIYVPGLRSGDERR